MGPNFVGAKDGVLRDLPLYRLLEVNAPLPPSEEVLREALSPGRDIVGVSPLV